MNTDLAIIPPDDAPHDQQLIEPFPGLTALESAFVRAYVEHGSGNATEAARSAGYAPSCTAAMGYRLLRKTAVLDAIRNETAHAVGAIAPIALKAMTKLLTAKSQFVQQAAAADLLDRAGFRPPDKHQHTLAGGIAIRIDMGD